MKNIQKENEELAIKVENVSKTFRIPHEKHTSLKAAALNSFRKKTFEEFRALNNINFEIKKGEFFGIIGRNGSGKSTLLKILAGIYIPDKGKIEINGKLSPFLELGVGFNMELTGRENVFLGGSILGLSKKEITKKFDQIVDFSEIGEFIDMKMKNYSSGMQVRLAFALAINAHAEILLMDEVLAVGDTNFQKKCLDVFKKLKTEGKTIIFVSHDIGKVKEFSDRVLLLNNGKIVTLGAPERTAFDYSKLMMNESNRTQEDQKKEEKSKKEKVNEILDIEAFDSEGKKCYIFEENDDLIFRIRVNVNKLEKDMFVSLAIRDNSNDAWICSCNSFYDNFNHNWKKGVNTITLKFPANTFHKGDFYLLCSFFKGNSKDGNIYDFTDSREKNFIFRVLPKDGRNGFVSMKYDWER